ncbi:DUF397 domain-containing protein [Nocardia sp. NBC_00511]|uniref:DUF397 domain-containing protein n=1 Tax=Nocardia sp. NBC_00511 TaxID=2903591 RepID=UPI0030E42832
MSKPVKGEWYKSSRSNTGNQCVEIFHADDTTLVRDTKDGGRGPILTFPASDWAKFVESRAWEC